MTAYVVLYGPTRAGALRLDRTIHDTIAAAQATAEHWRRCGAHTTTIHALTPLEDHHA